MMLEQPERPSSGDSNDLSIRPSVQRPRGETGPPDPRIEDYLDHVCAPLVGVVPYARRQELRAELREHLAAMAAAQQELEIGRAAWREIVQIGVGAPALPRREGARAGRQ